MSDRISTITRILMNLAVFFVCATVAAALALFTGWPVAILSGIVGFIAIGVFAPPPEESEPSAKADPTPAASESPSAEPVADESPKVDEGAALIARAEKAASSELPDVPYWKGATFKGTAVSKSKV